MSSEITLKRFAQMHPKLYRLARAGAHVGIRRHGLLPAAILAQRSGINLSKKPRKSSVEFNLPDGTYVTITDNRPLFFTKLAPVLDDGLTPEDWLNMLNHRVFFWPKREYGENNLKARRRLGYENEWQVFDTEMLLGPVWKLAEIAPFNTGATIHVPPRRGLWTFAKLDGLSYSEWEWSRGLSRKDKVKEVTVCGSVPDAAKALVHVEAA